MRHPVSQSLHAYWDGLRAGRTAPERADIDPAAIRHILAHTFVLEVEAAWGRGRDVRFRLSGTRLNALFARDLRGVPLDYLLAPEEAVTADLLLDGVLDDRAPMVAALQGGPPGAEPVGLELLLLPLRHHGRTHTRILGSLAAATVPGWMGLRPAAPLAVLGFHSVPAGPARPPVALPPWLAPGRSDEARIAAPRPQPGPRIPPGRFRVVEGGRRDAPPGLV